MFSYLTHCLGGYCYYNIAFYFRAGYVEIYRVSYMWYSTIAVMIVSVVGLIVSFITGTYNE